MVIEENKEVVRGLYEATSNIQGDLEKIPAIVDKFFSPEFVNHTLHGDFTVDMVVQVYQIGFTGLPDMKNEIHDIIAEEDKVVVRTTTTGTHKGLFANIPPTGKKISWSGTTIFRVSNGKVQEEWGNADSLGLFQQLGVLPSNEEFIQAYIDSLK